MTLAVTVALLPRPADASGGPVRVALLEAVPSLELGGGPLVVTDLAGARLGVTGSTWLRAVAASGGVELRGGPRPVQVAGVRVAGVTGGSVRVNAREYPGIVEIRPGGAGLMAINEVALPDYLAGTVRAEAGDRMPLEMLKAQAVVARTYALYHRRLNAAKPFHLVASTAHQLYSGRVPADSPSWVAVRETEGQVLLWEGDLFPAFYHSDSGGHTEDPRAVFAAPNMPALQPVRVEFASPSPHHRWSLDLDLGELAGLLRRGGVSVGRITGLEVLERSTSLRVARLAVHGTEGSAVLRGNEFRQLVGYDVLRSTLFAVAVDGVWARFAGRGYGHGVGLDQATARTMAELAYTASQILAYYFPGAVLASLEAAPSPRP